MVQNALLVFLMTPNAEKKEYLKKSLLRLVLLLTVGDMSQNYDVVFQGEKADPGSWCILMDPRIHQDPLFLS
jgi:hypothetical protein